MKPEDLKKAPKVLCESVSIAFTNEYFVFGMASGAQATVYSFTPEHAKRLQQYLTHQIAQYEKSHKVIDAKWDPNIVSPIQLDKK